MSRVVLPSASQQMLPCKPGSRPASLLSEWGQPPSGNSSGSKTSCPTLQPSWSMTGTYIPCLQ